MWKAIVKWWFTKRSEKYCKCIVVEHEPESEKAVCKVSILTYPYGIGKGGQPDWVHFHKNRDDNMNVDCCCFHGILSEFKEVLSRRNVKYTRLGKSYRYAIKLAEERIPSLIKEELCKKSLLT